MNPPHRGDRIIRLPAWRDRDLVTTVPPMTTLLVTLLLTWSGLGAWVYLDGRGCSCAPRVLESPADADLERDERLHGRLRDHQLVGLRERGDADGSRDHGFDADAERDKPLRL